MKFSVGSLIFFSLELSRTRLLTLRPKLPRVTRWQWEIYVFLDKPQTNGMSSSFEKAQCSSFRHLQPAVREPVDPLQFSPLIMLWIYLIRLWDTLSQRGHWSWCRCRMVYYRSIYVYKNMKCYHCNSWFSASFWFWSLQTPRESKWESTLFPGISPLLCVYYLQNFSCSS